MRAGAGAGLVDATKLLIEPTSALPVAAIAAGAVPGERIGIVLSGGNVDAAALAETIRVARTSARRRGASDGPRHGHRARR